MILWYSDRFKRKLSQPFSFQGLTVIMGAAGSVLRLDTLSSEEVGKYVAGIGKEYKPYKALIIEKGINGDRLSHMKNGDEITELLKTMGIKNVNHQKVLSSHLLKLITSFNAAPSQSSEDKKKIFPRDGIRLIVFHEFIMACGGREVLKSMTTKEVCERFVKPKTHRPNLSYCDILKSQNHPGVAVATVYISHSWSLSFLDLVDALDSHFGRGSQVSVWFDLFCFNQHNAGSGFEFWSAIIKSATSTLSSTVLVLSPWRNPVSLSRAWCVYEVFSVMENKGSMQVAMSRNEEDGFIDALRCDFDVIDDLAVTIDAKSLHATHAADKSRVLEEVQRGAGGSGLPAINRFICEILRDWSVVTMKKALEEEEDEENKLDLRITLGAMFRNLGKYAEAEPLLLQSLTSMQASLGVDHPDTLAAMNNLASIYESEGKYGEAETLLLRCIQLSTSVLGADDPITMTVMSSLADVYSSQQKYAAAEPLYLECLETSRAKLGPDHPDTMTSKNNLAYLYKSQRKYASAEPLYTRSLEMHRIKLGDDHPNTLSSMSGLATVYECQGRLDLAEPLYIEATEKGKAILGAAHPHVQEWNTNYEKFLRRKNALKNVTRSGSGKSINSNSSRRVVL